MMMRLSRWRCWRAAITYPRVNMDGALEGAPRHTPLCPAGHLPQGQGLRVEPLPLWGGVGEGSSPRIKTPPACRHPPHKGEG